MVDRRCPRSRDAVRSLPEEPTMTATARWLGVWLSIQSLGVAVTTAEARPPNFVVILADDLGYADLGCQGTRDIKTPHIDSIAQNGIRFTDGYVSCTVCSPSRA